MGQGDGSHWGSSQARQGNGHSHQGEPPQIDSTMAGWQQPRVRGESQHGGSYEEGMSRGSCHNAHGSGCGPDDEEVGDNSHSSNFVTGYEIGHRLQGSSSSFRGGARDHQGSSNGGRFGHHRMGYGDADQDSGGPRLRSVLDFEQPLSALFAQVFSFDVFNSVQTAVCDKALSDKSLVVVSPTGSGKTVIFELAICSLFRSQWGHRHSNGDSKAIFLAVQRRPTRMIVNAYSDVSAH